MNNYLYYTLKQKKYCVIAVFFKWSQRRESPRYTRYARYRGLRFT